jgi:hypothetical protein
VVYVVEKVARGHRYLYLAESCARMDVCGSD